MCLPLSLPLSCALSLVCLVSMLDTSMLDAETGAASSSGFTYAAQYGVRRASTRPDVYRTQFGSISADEFLTPMLPSQPRNDGNVARRLSRNSFLIPPQTFVRQFTDGMWISSIHVVVRSHFQMSLSDVSFSRIRMRFSVSSWFHALSHRRWHETNEEKTN